VVSTKAGCGCLSLNFWGKWEKGTEGLKEEVSSKLMWGGEEGDGGGSGSVQHLTRGGAGAREREGNKETA